MYASADSGKLPPHGRGWTRAVFGTAFVDDASPARAGMDLGARPSPKLISSFPRTGGDGPWAQSADCGGQGYTSISHHRALSGQLGEDGQACLRFGGALELRGAHEGRYAGAVQVRLTTL